MTDVLLDRVCTAVANVLNIDVDQVTRETSTDTVEKWDSLNIINIMLALETEFGVTFDMEEASGLLSVELIIAILNEKGLT